MPAQNITMNDMRALQSSRHRLLLALILFLQTTQVVPFQASRPTSRILSPIPSFHECRSLQNRWPSCTEKILPQGFRPKGKGTTTKGSKHEDFRWNNSKASASKFFQAVFLIAGTTVGGGFLALPATVVVPLGGFLPSLAALVLVWCYLLTCSLILCDCIVLAQRLDEGKSAIGIPKTANRALGGTGSNIASVLLVSLTIATLVSQLSRAGSLYASVMAKITAVSGVAAMKHYRLGCVLATAFGASITHGRPLETFDERQGAKTIQNDYVTKPTTTTSFADKVNTILTAIFLTSAVLLFYGGSSIAKWSSCWELPISSGVFPIAKMVEASPIMLQLLVYGEICPNVCDILDYDTAKIRKAVMVGSFIPLLLLSGWAAFGVALLSSSQAIVSNLVDPVDVLLATGGSVASRLLTLAVSAIGTTILGSFLALQSAYGDWTAMEKMERRFWRKRWVRTLAISAPPLLISCISPSVFLQAIDFAGSYPVLLLYGVLPPLILRKLSRQDGGDASRSNKLYALIGLFSFQSTKPSSLL